MHASRKLLALVLSASAFVAVSAHAQKDPAKPVQIIVPVAPGGQGSITHMVAEFFQYRAGVKMNHVPYKGTGPALTDTISGQTDIFFSSTATALPHVKSGRLRAIAVTSAKRLPAEAEVPTIAESGVKDFDDVLCDGLIGPKNLTAPLSGRAD